MNSTAVKIDIRRLSKTEILEWFLEMGEKKFRAKQVYEWLWEKSASSFQEMTNLSKALREKLETHFTINIIQEDKVQRSNDGTIKSRFQLHDGHFIESVLIPVPSDKRFTVCVSSQVGCSLSCKFCATGKMKRVRNLDAGEIYDQVVKVNQQALATFGHPLTNIVYMGMGEPLLAYKNVLKSIEHITSPEGLNMSPKRITVSTAGIANLKRNEIMPINEQNNLEILMEALSYFHQNTKNRISFEYIAFQNFNDSLEDAANLVDLCRDFPVRINIIEYNPIDGAIFQKAAAHRIDEFAKYLIDRDIMVTVRRSRGKDIDAACGQLANKD